MYEQLDNDLKKRIEELFENVESPTAEEGWIKLLEKFPLEKKNRIAFIWFYWGAAAILFLFFGIGLLYYKTSSDKYADKFKHGNSEILLVKKTENSNKNDNQVHTKTESQFKEKKNLTPALNYAGNKQEPDSSTSPGVANLISNNKIISVTGAKRPIRPHKYETSVKHSGIKEKNIPEKMINESGFVENNNIADNENSKFNTEQRNSEILSMANQKFNILIAPLGKPLNLLPINILEDKSAIYKMLAETNGHKADEKTTEDKKLKFGIYEATYLNYAKGSQNEVNLGLGVSSDIYLSNNLSLSTGLALAKNTLSYSSNIALNAAQNDYVAATLPSVYSLAGNSFNPATTVKNYSAGLLGLDIPINIKYNLGSGNNNIYVSAGFSSGTFINETYTYQYGFPAASYPFSQQTQGTSTSKNFDSFYFAKTINLAFGAGLPFGKKRFFAEPFLKYPIGGLGSQNIQFGAGGLNLKFKF